MNQLVLFVLQQVLRMAFERLQNMGKLENLTQEEANALIAKWESELSTDLPSPGDIVGE